VEGRHDGPDGEGEAKSQALKKKLKEKISEAYALV
jgi:hypothetical protein